MNALATARLTIAPVQLDDAAELLAYHERNRDHLRPWEPDPAPDFYTLEYWQRFVAVNSESETRLRVLARPRAEPHGTIVASVNLHPIQRGIVQRAVLGYSVDAAYEGRGYGREAVAAVVSYAFDVLGLHRVEANYQPINERSGRLLRSLGFGVEGYARDYLYLAGAWRDHILTSLTKGGTPR